MSHAIKRIKGVSIEFLPCPFCGNSPEWVEVQGSDYIMRCASCHASTKVARWTPEEAADDWNSNDIEDDNFTITEDTKIDEYLKQRIKKVLFGKCSTVKPFPVVDGGFLCSSAVIVTEKTIICIESEKAHLLYDELCGYGRDYYIKPMTEKNNEISFVKSRWRKDNLLSVSFCCDGRTTTISSYVKSECLIVREEF